jgi:hypothetical protein
MPMPTKNTAMKPIIMPRGGGLGLTPIVACPKVSGRVYPFGISFKQEMIKKNAPECSLFPEKMLVPKSAIFKNDR